jgi:pimeloyl-ACP methyl ester carboxylesterase
MNVVAPELFVDEQIGSSGRRIVLIHGAMDRYTSFARIRRVLSAHTTVAYDRRGYSRSIDATPATSLQDHVDDLSAVVGDVASVIVGHSYGGVVALTLAAQRPEVVQALMVYEAPMPWMSWWPGNAGGSTIDAGAAHGPEAAAESFMRRIVGDRIWERLGEETRAARRAEGPALLLDLVGLRQQGQPYDLAAIRCPVVVARGSESHDHQKKSAVELAAMLEAAGNRHVQLVELSGANHGAHAAKPDAFAELIERAVVTG